MPVDAEFRAILDQIEAAPRIHQTPIPELRARGRTPIFPKPAVARVEDMIAATADTSTPVRFYRPLGSALPLVIFFHGGGFVFGGLEGYYDPLCRRIALEAGCAVLSVDYRLAPEHKFPAAADDALGSLVWALNEAKNLDIDPDRIITAGPSAGGNLAAVAALRARDAGLPKLAGQALFYPVLDYHTPATPSYVRYAEGHHLTRTDMIWFWNHYLAKPSDADNPYAAPLRAPKLDDLPPAFIVAAECDPLCDEATTYAGRLKEAGVDVTLLLAPGLIHGFLGYPTSRTHEVVRRAIDWIRSRTQTPDVR